jgi:transcriptional regulator with XRE-family HTH domain
MTPASSRLKAREASAGTKVAPRHDYERELLYGEAMETITALIQEQGISQRELARRLDLDEARLSRILSGRTNVTLKTIADLGWALGLRFSLAAIPLDDRSQTPAAADPKPPSWLARLRRQLARASVAEAPPSVRANS